MSLLPSLNATSVENGIYDYYFALKSESGKNWSKFKASSPANMSGYGISDIGGLGLDNAGITGVSLLDIDGQILTADPTDLLLNGVPIATINNLPNIEEWANYDALNNVVMNGAGISGAPYGITGSKFYGFNAGSTLSASNNTLFFNGSAIAGATGGTNTWSTFSAISSVNLGGYNLGNALNLHSASVTADSSISSPSSTFTNSTITNATITNLNVANIDGSGYTGVSNWALFPAISSIKTAGNDISAGTGHGLNVTAGNDINITSSTGNITLTPGVTGILSQNLNSTAGQINLVADQGIIATQYSDLNLTAQNGNRGRVNITANAGVDGELPTPGEVHILANGGSFKSAVVGGLVTIDATTPSIGPAATSAIKLAASGINSYAGYRGSLGSLAGYNYLYGSLGVNITASVVPPSVNTPGTIYLGADNSVVCGANLYVYQAIYPYYNGVTPPLNLTLSGRTVGGVDYGVYMEIVGAINFSSSLTGKINGCKVFAGNSTTMSGISSIETGTINSTGTATLHDISTDTINAKTSNSLSLNGVNAITGNAIVINSGSGTITIEGAETDITSTNTYITNAEIDTLTATTINGVSGTNVVAPCKSLTGTFGVVALTTAPIVVYQSGDLTWNWNGIAKLGTSTSITVGVDTVGTYAFSMAFLVGGTIYSLNTYTLSAPFVANSGSYNGVSVVSATLNDSFNNTITNGSTYNILVYMWNGNNSTANTTGAKLNFNFVSAQSL